MIRAMREHESTQETQPAPREKRTKFPRDAKIHVLESRVKSKGKTKARWEKLLGSEDKTVGHYLDNIGTSGDLTWWSDQQKIRIG